MDFSLTEEQKMLKEMAGDYFKREVPRTLVKDIMDGARLPRRVWEQMAAMGFMGLEIPREYGGSGGSFLDTVILLEEMGKACLPGPFFSTVNLGAATVMASGNADQKAELLPPVAEGNSVITLAAAERNAADNPKYFKVKATAQGDHYVIDGVKSCVPDAEDADFIICLARAGEAGLTLFLVPRASGGLSLAPLPSIAWERQSEAVFKKVRVPAGNVLGQVGKGWEHYQAVLQRAAVAKCAEMVGGCDYVLQMTVQYAKDRAQFGRPIGAFQAVQHHCANMLLDLEVARYLTYQAAWRIAERLPCAREAAMAKAWLNDAAYRITVLGHQVHGAVGYCWDHDMHLYYKLAKIGGITFGDTPHYHEVVAAGLGLY